MSRGGKEPGTASARRLTLWISVAAAILCAGVAWYTANAAMWILGGISLASGIAATRIGGER